MRGGIVIGGILLMSFATVLFWLAAPGAIIQGDLSSATTFIMLSFILGPIGLIVFIAGLVMMHPLKKKLLKQQLQELERRQ